MKPAIGWCRLLVSQTEHQPQVYNVRFLRSTNRCTYPFSGCLGSSCTLNGLHSHFSIQHWGDRISITEEDPNPIPKCECCGIQVPSRRLNTRHYTSEKCKQGKKSSLRHKTIQICFKASRVSFQINAETLPPLKDFPYLGRTISYNNRNWAAVYQNLRKDQRLWGMVARVLESTGATMRARG